MNRWLLHVELIDLDKPDGEQLRTMASSGEFTATEEAAMKDYEQLLLANPNLSRLVPR